MKTWKGDKEKEENLMHGIEMKRRRREIDREDEGKKDKKRKEEHKSEGRMKKWKKT